MPEPSDDAVWMLLMVHRLVQARYLRYLRLYQAALLQGHEVLFLGRRTSGTLRGLRQEAATLRQEIRHLTTLLQGEPLEGRWPRPQPNPPPGARARLHHNGTK
jgi:hypothetical protein